MIAYTAYVRRLGVQAFDKLNVEKDKKDHFAQIKIYFSSLFVFIT